MKVQLEVLSHDSSAFDGQGENSSSLSLFHVDLPLFDKFWHFHPELELTYIIEGQGVRMIGDRIAPFEAGDLVLVGPNLVHGWESDAHYKGPCRAAGVHFQANVAPQITDFQSLNSMIREADAGLWFRNPGERITSRLLALKNLNPARRHLSFLELLLDMSESPYETLSQTTFTGLNSNHDEQRRVVRATSYIMSNYQKPLKLADAAAHMSFSPNYFSRWFRQSVGQSFVDYLNAARTEHACQLLLKTDLNIGEIAFQSGFESTSSFNRHFRSRKGLSPRELRRDPVDRA